MALEEFEHNGFTVTIDHDPDTESPRGDTHGCELVMAHRRYSWPNDAGIVFDNFEGWEAIAQELRDQHGALVVEDVWAYDHSGIALKTGERTYPFDDVWDSGQAGLAYVTRENWKETQGTEWTGSEEQVTQARRLIADDVADYGQWANGACYYYSITDECGDTVNSCGGYIGMSVIEAAKAAADALEHEVKCNGSKGGGA